MIVPTLSHPYYQDGQGGQDNKQSSLERLSRLYADVQWSTRTKRERQWRIGIDVATDINDVVELRDLCCNCHNEIIFYAIRGQEQRADAHRRAEALAHRRAEAECSQVLSTMRKTVQTIEASLRGP